MSSYILIAIVVVWLLAFVWVVQDAVINLPGNELIWWILLALLLGPFAIPLYLSQRLARRAQQRTVGRGRTTTVPVPSRAKPFRSAGIRRVEPDSIGGSGVFVVIETGRDAGKRIELPGDGELTVRRAIGDEQSHGAVLVLHDDGVSRDGHCRIGVRGSQIVLEDTSSFGTKVGRDRVHQASRALASGSRVEVGHTRLRIE